MKRILAVILSLMLMANLFAGCNTSKRNTNVSTTDNGMVNGSNGNLDMENQPAGSQKMNTQSARSQAGEANRSRS